MGQFYNAHVDHKSFVVQVILKCHLESNVAAAQHSTNVRTQRYIVELCTRSTEYIVQLSFTYPFTYPVGGVAQW